LILDLACGAGEVTLALKGIGYTKFEGIDPYTYEVYEQKTGLKC
jgi:ubiquinone/menaquinone biosynthesis C-methylase UbiE